MKIKVETRGLGKRYKEVVALAPTDLQVQHGEFLTLLGPSGSGKTTLLQMIAGLVVPTQGRLLIDGVDATDIPASARGVGLVFQSYALFPHMSVGDNVAYPLRMRRVARDEIKRSVHDALTMVRMQDFAGRYPSELSGGQQQRVALARCFVYRPSVILLDEPLGALDKKLREHMQLEIRRLHRELNATFIYVTHDQEEALTMSDRICLMNDARIEQIGTPRDLYDRPESRFAADFLGHSNLLDAEVCAGVLNWRGLSLPVPQESAEFVGPASLLVRPESAELVAPGTGFIRGVVSQAIFTGSDMRVIIDIGDGQQFFVRTNRELARAPGDTVGITWNARESVLLTR